MASFTNISYCKIETYIPTCHSRGIGNPLFAVASNLYITYERMEVVRNIDGETFVYGIIANPVIHSLSPAVHNAAYEALGINYVYVPFLVEDIAKAASGIRALNIKGVSVSIPHKVSIMNFLDEIDPLAKNIGAVNTVANHSGVLKGFNTDGMGALQAFRKRGINLDRKRILILGSGGAARSIGFTAAMKTEGVEIRIQGIIPDEVDKLVSDITLQTNVSVKGFVPCDETLKDNVKWADVLIHCTPVGMAPDAEDCLVEQEYLHNDIVVFDAVYTPRITELLKRAEKQGCTIIPGFDMFLNQAVAQFELWTGINAPVDVMKKVLDEKLPS